MTTKEYLDGIIKNNRFILSKAITLIESSLDKDQKKSIEIIENCIDLKRKTIRIGISGTPGVGKSTFIESLGLHLVRQKYKVAILTIDPSSTISKGSILGDKTRMQKLANNDLAFIRPSPNNGKLGGVHNSTKDVITLCEAAGYDIIIIETVGVGQSEMSVQLITDLFLYLTLVENGDDLQFIKKGVLELSDMIIINKMDLNFEKAKQVKFSLENHLNMSSEKKQYIFTCSALENSNIKEIWNKIESLFQKNWNNNTIQVNRNKRNIIWLKKLIKEGWIKILKQDSKFQNKISHYHKYPPQNTRKIALEILGQLDLS